MSNEPRSSLRTKFVENTIALCGEKGRVWLDELPELIASLEFKWAIKAEKHFRNLSYNYVANALLRNGKTAVLKIGLPLTDVEIYGEAAYLKSLDGAGTVKLLEFDRDKQAVLLERVSPGATLRSVCRKDQAGAVTIAVKSLKRVLKPVPNDVTDLISLDSWFDGLKRAIGAKFPQDYASKALDIYAELSADTKNIFLLHGDLHHDNILSATREPYLLIDPKGMIGHVGYDIGVFLNNHHDWLEWDTRLEGKLDRAVAEFASALDLEPPIIRKWAYCQMVLSWWWMFDEMPETFGEELGLSDVWKV
ncbi:MAG: aminoglycoside phosphotransferase family protein [Acidobacteriota bacterium]